MLLSNHTFEFEQHEVEWVEVMCQWVARGNIQQISYTPQVAAYALQAHAALSGGCHMSYNVNTCMMFTQYMHDVYTLVYI